MQLSADPARRYLTQTGNTTGGPYSFEGLESLVYLQRITPDTLIAPEGSNAFVPLRHTELAPLLFKNLATAKHPKDWAAPGQEHRAGHANRTRYRLGEARFEKINQAHPRRGKIDVLDLLHDIRQQEIAAGRDELKPPRFRLKRRSLDFWFLLLTGNAVFFGTAVYMQSTTSLVFGIAGCGIYTFGLSWSMYGVMDKY